MTPTDPPAPTPESVMESLAGLGTGRQVADLLAASGIRGIPGHPCRCPVANYVRRLTGVDIDLDGLSWCHTYGHGPDHATPRAVAEFVREFDADATYPHLIEPRPALRAGITS